MENSGTVKERQYVIHLNSDEFEKAPAVSGINFGEIAVNYCSASPAIYIKVQSGDTSASQYTVAFRDVDWIMNHFSGGSPDVSELIRKINELSGSTVGIQSGYVKTVCFSDSGAGQSNIGLDRTESSSDGATYTFDFSKIEINCGSF